MLSSLFWIWRLTPVTVAAIFLTACGAVSPTATTENQSLSSGITATIAAASGSSTKIISLPDGRVFFQYQGDQVRIVHEAAGTYAIINVKSGATTPKATLNCPSEGDARVILNDALYACYPRTTHTYHDRFTVPSNSKANAASLAWLELIGEAKSGNPVTQIITGYNFSGLTFGDFFSTERTRE